MCPVVREVVVVEFGTIGENQEKPSAVAGQGVVGQGVVVAAAE